MYRSTVHIPGLFHTVNSNAYSSCAFTGKAMRFPEMMQRQGWDAVEYSNGQSQSTCKNKVMMLSESELLELKGPRDPAAFYGNDAVLSTPWYSEFDNRLRRALRDNVKDGDIICHPFGRTHESLLGLFPKCFHVETGIGYNELIPDSYKIFESHAWRHWHLGRENKLGSNYSWVIPNYYDVEEWEIQTKPGSYIAFMGRIGSTKGMDTVREIAKRASVPVKICGQGDPSAWVGDNMEFLGPITGAERCKFLGGAICTLMPTTYVEPFGGSAIESTLVGTPVLSVDFGAFAETIVNGVNGYRCQTLREWLNGIGDCRDLDRFAIARRARDLYGLDAVGPQYTRAFEMLYGLRGDGWYAGC